MSIVFRNYPEENYKVIFNQKSGFFARVESEDSQEPFWASKGPELLDISITNWCDRDCTFCYKNSDQSGQHMALNDYKWIMSEAQKNNVFQVALGGGNPNQHPDFIEILKISRSYNIVPSYTTNGRMLSQKIIDATKEFCGGVAVSAYAPYKELGEALVKFSHADIKPNIHFVLDANSIHTAIKWLEEGQEFLKNCNALIFLNYKPVGNQTDNSNLLRNSDKLKYFFELVDNNTFPFRIGFDSCMVSGIVTYMKNYKNISLEPCDAGRFSAYISEDMKMYPCSFMIEQYEGVSLKNRSLLDVWNDSNLFNTIRGNFKGNRCFNCNQQSNCLNGCPFLREIDLC